MYYTSGTTSDPKGAQHTDGTLLAGGIGLALKLDMQPSDVGSIAFPYSHIGGPNYVVMMLTHGMPAVLLEAFVPAEAVEIYKRHDVTMAGGSTAFYISFINEQRKQPGEKIIPTLRILSGGGAPKPPELFLEVANEIDARLCHGYGMTECPMISQGGPRDSDDQLMYSEGGPVEGCVITIIREDGSFAKPNEVGEVRLEGPMLLKGYRDDALNADAFDDQGRFRTGDIGFLRPDGYITLTGRLKDVIIRKGENISAKEVEDILYTHPKVGDCAVIGLIDRERGERVCAVVETAPGQTPLTFEEMVAWCKEAGPDDAEDPRATRGGRTATEESHVQDPQVQAARRIQPATTEVAVMTDRLRGKVAIVTGASRGIGEAIARGLAAEGARVACVARTRNEGDKRVAGSLQATVAAIEAAGGEAVPLVADLRDLDACARVVGEARSRLGSDRHPRQQRGVDMVRHRLRSSRSTSGCARSRSTCTRRWCCRRPSSPT